MKTTTGIGWLRALALCSLLAVTTASCDLFGESTGACVSDAVSFSFGLRVYCNNNFDESECRARSADQVNGASWTFHGGQTCADRDLTEGSNPFP
ncbi:MAG: hypothetical protein AAF845_13850 [Bacteroidota bacterium]